MFRQAPLEKITVAVAIRGTELYEHVRQYVPKNELPESTRCILSISSWVHTVLNVCTALCTVQPQ